MKLNNIIILFINKIHKQFVQKVSFKWFTTGNTLNVFKLVVVTSFLLTLQQNCYTKIGIYKNTISAYLSLCINRRSHSTTLFVQFPLQLLSNRNDLHWRSGKSSWRYTEHGKIPTQTDNGKWCSPLHLFY